MWEWLTEIVKGPEGKVIRWVADTWQIWVALLGLVGCVIAWVLGWLSSFKQYVCDKVKSFLTVRRSRHLQSLMFRSIGDKEKAPTLLYKSDYLSDSWHTPPFPFLILNGDYMPVNGEENSIATTLWDKAQRAQHIEVCVAIPGITSEEKEKRVQASQKIDGSPSRAMVDRSLNRRASIDVVGNLSGQSDAILCQVVVRATNVVDLSVFAEQDERDLHTLFDDGKTKIDTSQWVRICITHDDGTTVVQVSGETIYGSPTKDEWGKDPSDTGDLTLVHWPPDINLRVGAVSQYVRPIAFFSKPECW